MSKASASGRNLFAILTICVVERKVKRSEPSSNIYQIPFIAFFTRQFSEKIMEKKRERSNIEKTFADII